MLDEWISQKYCVLSREWRSLASLSSGWSSILLVCSRRQEVRAPAFGADILITAEITASQSLFFPPPPPHTHGHPTTSQRPSASVFTTPCRHWLPLLLGAYEVFVALEMERHCKLVSGDSLVMFWLGKHNSLLVLQLN